MMPTEMNLEAPSADRSEVPKVVAAAPRDAEDSVDLLDLVLLLAGRKRFILAWSFSAAIVTVILVSLMAKSYTAVTTMMPPQQESSASALLGQLGGLASLTGGGGAAGMLGLKNPADLYIGLMQSETVQDEIIRRFDLMRLHKIKKWSAARAYLKGHTKFVTEKSSLISISVTDKDPKMAAAIANAYIDALHDLTSHLAISEAAQRRVFFEQQLEQEKNNLASAEVALEATEKKTGIIEPQGQASAVIATIMQLRAQISANEVALDALRTSATEENPEVIRLQSQIAGLRAQLADFEKGHPGAVSGSDSVLTPTAQVPAASLAYIRAMRDVRYHETLFEILARQYEMARVDEAKQGQMIQVVDPALVPDKKSWPPRLLFTLLAFILGAILSSLWVIVTASYKERMQSTEFAWKMEQLKRSLRWRSEAPHEV
jgi:tyrosine-protein kinase Etk/Wzc